MTQTVEHFLSLSNAENLSTKMNLGAGCGVAIWENRNDHVRYEAPHNNTFSLYLKGGTGTRRLDASKVSGWPGAVCIMPAGQSSEWEITKRFRFVHLYLSDERLRSMFAEAHDCDARQLDLPEANFADKPNMAQPLAELAHAAMSNNMLHAEGALTDLIGGLSGRQTRLLGGLAPHILRRVEDYIEAYLASTIHLNDLALLANMSEFHFHRMFRLVQGCPPHTWITKQRVRRAKQLLGSDTPLVEVAVDCGFSSQSHLTRVFQKQTGRTPAQYRKLLRDT